jgi:hypothetical protein
MREIFTICTKNICSSNLLSIICLDIENFPLMSGWALRSNQKYGKKGSGKRMTATVKAYLEGYFLAGNVNKTDRMSAKDMVMQLQDLAKEGEIQLEDVPEIKTVEGWIARYSSSLKKKYAAQRVAENNISGDQNETINNGI